MEDRILGIIGTAYTIYDVTKSGFDSGMAVAGAKIAVSATAGARACISGVGWAIGIGIADYMWGDELYRWVGEVSN